MIAQRLITLLVVLVLSSFAARFSQAALPQAPLTPAEFDAARLVWPASAAPLLTGHPPLAPADEARLALLQAALRLDRRSPETAAPAFRGWLAGHPLDAGRPEATLGLGLALLQSGQPRPALAVLGGGRSAFEHSGTRDDLRFWQGEAAWTMEDYAGAAEAFGGLATEPHGAWRGQAMYRLAWAENRLGQHDASASHFEAAALLSPDLAESADLQRGWVLLQEGRTGDARGLFEQVERSKVDARHEQEAVIGQAECLYRENDFAAAGKLYDAALARAPDAQARAALRYSLAWTALKQKQYAVARGKFLDVERDFPQDPVAPFAAYRAALALLDLNQPQDALVELKGIGARYPAHEVGEWSAYSRGWIHLSLNRFNDAKAAFRALLDAYPKGKLVAPTKYLIAATLCQERRFKDSEREFLSFVDGYAESGLADGALLWAGWAALLDGRAKDALDHFDRLGREYPRTAFKPDAAVAEGEAAFALQLYPRARAAYQIAAAAPGDLRMSGLIGLGWCGFATKDWKEAETNFRTVAQEAPAGRIRGRATVRLGDAVFNQKRYPEAEAEYRRVIAGSEEDLARWAQLQLGWCSFRRENPDEARRQWDQLRRRWPSSPEAPLALQASAETLFRQEQYPAAEQLFRQLQKEAHGNPPVAEAAALRIGDCLYNAKSYAAAVLAYKEFSTTYTKSERLAEALYGMQWAYLQLGQFEEARQEAGKFLEKFPQAGLAAEVQLMLAESYRRDHKPAEALDQYKALTEKYPDSDLVASAQLKMGEVQEELKQWKEAQATYQAFIAAHPKHPLARDAAFRLAVARYAAGDVAGAKEQFAKTAEDITDPHAAEALYNLLLCAKKAGDEPGMAEALKRLTADFARSRAAFQARLAYGYYLADKGSRDEAAVQMTAAMDAPFPDISGEAASAQGDALAAKGDKAGALAAYLKGAADLPQGGEWQIQCAFSAAPLLGDAGKHGDAVDLLRKVLEMAAVPPESQANACFGIAQQYEAMKLPVQAAQMYKECLKRSPPADIKGAAESRLKALAAGAGVPESVGEDGDGKPAPRLGKKPKAGGQKAAGKPKARPKPAAKKTADE